MSGWTPEELSQILPTSAPVRSQAPRTARPGAKSAVGQLLAEPLPPRLSTSLRRLLCRSDGLDRSAQFYRLVMGGISEGLTAGQLLTLASMHPPSVEKYGDSPERQVLAVTDKHPHMGRTCAAAACTNQRDDSHRAVVNEELQAFFSAYCNAVDAYDWPGRTGRTERALVLAHLDVAERLGRIDYDLSEREAAERANVARSTVQMRNADAVRHGWIEAMQPGSRPDQKAGWWRLRGDNLSPHLQGAGGPGTPVESDTTTPLPVSVGPSTHKLYGPTLSSGAKADAFSYGGLGRAAEVVYHHLLSGDLTCADLAGRVGSTTRTVQRAVKRLRDHGLAEQAPSGRWRALTREWAAVAGEQGVLGVGERRKRRHARERDGFAEYRRVLGIDPTHGCPEWVLSDYEQAPNTTPSWPSKALAAGKSTQPGSTPQRSDVRPTRPSREQNLGIAKAAVVGMRSGKAATSPRSSAAVEAVAQPPTASNPSGAALPTHDVERHAFPVRQPRFLLVHDHCFDQTAIGAELVATLLEAGDLGGESAHGSVLWVTEVDMIAQTVQALQALLPGVPVRAADKAPADLFGVDVVSVLALLNRPAFQGQPYGLVVVAELYRTTLSRQRADGLLAVARTARRAVALTASLWKTHPGELYELCRAIGLPDLPGPLNFTSAAPRKSLTGLIHCSMLAR